jgi:DNA primase
MRPWVDFSAVKRGVDMEQVLAGYGLRMKRVRKDYLRGRCPLPTHSSACSGESFGVDTAKKVWACHSASCCRARQGRVGGNILDLVAQLEGCSIREAALRLEARRGVWAEDQLVSKGKIVERPRKELAELPFRLRLSGWHPYLEERGVNRQTAACFGIGFYAGGGFLRNRILFPIHDSRGRLVAYAGRSIDGTEPRYLFPPGFPKSQVVFNLHRAMDQAGGPPQPAIVVEGFFDCLKVHQAGYGNVVALMGTNFSEVQEKLLLERFSQLVLMLDEDQAGRRASQQLSERLRPRISLAWARLPPGRQPDQLSIGEIQRILRGARVVLPGG